MTSPLDSLIATKINAKLGPKLQAGSLRRETPGGLDEWGDPIGSTFATYAFKGYRDDFSATYKATAGIPVTDYEIGILAKSITVEPKQGDEILLKGQWSEIRAIIEIDPATALYRCQCYRVDDPTT